KMLRSRMLLVACAVSGMIGCTFDIAGFPEANGAAASTAPDLAMPTGAPPSTSNPPDLGPLGDPTGPASPPADLAEPRVIDMAEASAPDLAGPACTLGTVDNCGQCGLACPGADSSATQRVCTAADPSGRCDV